MKRKLRRNLCPKFSYSDYLCFSLVFYLLYSIHADRENTADGNEKSFVLKRRGGAALNDTNGAEWEAGLSLSLSLSFSLAQGE